MATRKVSRETTMTEPPNAPKPTLTTMATEREAREATEAIRTKFENFTASYWQLGQALREGVTRQYAKVLGLKMNDWLDKCASGKGLSRAKLQRAMKIVAALRGVEDEFLHKLSEGNAYELSTLPESKRKSAEWLDKAATMGNVEFKAEVAKALGKESKPEEWFDCFPRMPMSVKSLVDDVKRVLAEEIFQFDPEDEKKFIGVWEKIFVSLYQDFQTAEGVQNVRVWLVGEDGSAPPVEAE